MNRRHCTWVRASVALAALACSAEARAADPERPARLALSWAAPATCIEAKALAELIERTLGRAVFVDAGSADARLKGTINAQGRGFRVRLEVRADDASPLLATRDLDVEATECRALDGAIAVVAALLVDGTPAVPDAPSPPSTTLRVTLPQRPPSVPSPPRPLTPPALATPPLPSSPRLRPPLGAFLGAEGGVTFGFLPGPASFGGASAWIAPLPALRVGIDARAWSAQRKLAGESGAEISAFALAVAGCWRAASDRVLALSMCARLDVGVLLGEPIALQSTGAQRRSLILPGVEARAGLRVAGPLYLELAPEFGAPLARPLFYYVDRLGKTQDVHRMSAIVFGLGIALGARFGD